MRQEKTQEGGVHDGDSGFHPAGPADLAPGRVACRTVAGRRLLVVRAEDGSWHATAPECTHMGLSLERARVRGAALLCPHHGARFDLATGGVLSAPASEELAVYAVRIRGDRIEVRL